MLYKITTHSLFYKGKYYPVGTLVELPVDVAATLPNTIPVKEEDSAIPEKKLDKKNHTVKTNSVK